MRPSLFRLLICCLAALANPTAGLAEEVVLDRPSARLAGTLALPDTPRAVALILPGSGPVDRNGNSTNGLATDAYRLLAEALAADGIATLRADKRGVGKSGGAGNDVTLSVYAEDAGTWIEMLRQRTGATCAWLIGHSEGGLVALETARTREDICGLVLMATPGRPASQIMLEQLRAVPSLRPHLNAAEDAMFALLAGQTVPIENLPGPLAGIFAPQVQPFLIDLFAFDPLDVARTVTPPVLVIQGTADLQIPVENTELLNGALAQGRVEIVDGMTHMLKTAPGETRADNLATYGDPGLPLSEGLVEAISGFIRAQP